MCNLSSSICNYTQNMMQNNEVELVSSVSMDLLSSNCTNSKVETACHTEETTILNYALNTRSDKSCLGSSYLCLQVFGSESFELAPWSSSLWYGSSMRQRPRCQWRWVHRQPY
jgi:hypothetical protein